MFGGLRWMRLCPIVIATTATTTAIKRNMSTMNFSKLTSYRTSAQRVIDSFKRPVLESMSNVLSHPNAGQNACHDDKADAVPMPYSSICSPSHMRKTLPAVMVRRLKARNRTCRSGMKRQNHARKPRHERADVHAALEDANNNLITSVFVDFLAPALAFFLQFLERGRRWPTIGK